MRAPWFISLGVALALALGLAPAAAAHSGGKAEPRIAAGLTGNGLSRDLVVRLTDVDSREPISKAIVTAAASMTRPHAMQLAPQRVPETRAGTYEARVQLVMPAVWTIRIAVTGEDVVAASATLRAKVGRSPSGSAEPPAAPVTTLPTQIEATLVRSDYTTMAVLWIHSLAAMGWIVGVLVMLLALGTDPGILAEGIRTKVRDAYRDWGAWLHWSLVPWIVLTGIYNLLVVTPFPLAWRPDEVRRLADVPYGALYEAILIVKLGLFAALLVTGTMLLRRTVRAPAPVLTGNPHPVGFARTLARALGPAGVLYLVTVPLILAAAMALRYVHILSHVATVLNESS